MYYNDINIKMAVHRYFSPPDKEEYFTTESNSMEFIRFGHLHLLRKRDNRIIDLTAPAYFWMRQDEQYRFSAGDRNQQGRYVEHIYFDFSGERSGRMVAALDELYPDGMFYPRRPDEVGDIFFQILRLYRIDPVSRLPEIGMLAEKLMFIAYDSNLKTVAKDKARDAYGLDKIAETIRSEPFQKYDFREIASGLELSMDHFRRLFREKHQLTPQLYLYHQRMIRAAELLEKTDMRIKEIMYTCRFQSDIDFSRSFKKYSGLSPRNYREQFRKKAIRPDCSG